MKVEFIGKSGADHAFDSTLIGLDNGWILSIGADNPIIERVGDTVNWAVNKQMDINDIAFVDFGNFVFFDRRNDSCVGTTFGAVVHAKDYCKSTYHTT